MNLLFIERDASSRHACLTCNFSWIENVTSLLKANLFVNLAISHKIHVRSFSINFLIAWTRNTRRKILGMLARWNENS